MIEKIEMYKVGFGDCFICSDYKGNNKMLVDYGSTGTIPQAIIDEVNKSLSNTQDNYLMITHFHSDHFNGLQHLNNHLNFSEIYLPNFFNNNIIKLEFIALVSNPKNFTNKNYNIAFNLLTCVPTLARHFIKRSRVFFLNTSSKAHTINSHKNNLDDLRILWPDIDYVEDHAKKLTETISQHISDDQNMQLEEYSNRFLEILSRIKDNNVLYFREGNTERIININTLVDECQQNLNLELSNDLLRKISSFQNELCLCFDNANKNNDKPVLFLSDISKQCYNQLIDINEIARYYSTIKVPHHGTPSYFIDNLPESENLLIPNDNKRKTWLISSDYFITYSSRNIFPNLPCSHLNRLKSRNCSGVPDYFCTHYLCI